MREVVYESMHFRVSASCFEKQRRVLRLRAKLKGSGANFKDFHAKSPKIPGAEREIDSPRHLDCIIRPASSPVFPPQGQSARPKRHWCTQENIPCKALQPGYR